MKARVLESCGADERFGGKIAAADGPFHGRGPAGGRPISSKKNAGPGGGCGRPVGVDTRAWRISGVKLFDYGGLHEIGFARGGEEFAHLSKREVHDVGARFVDQSL